MPAKQWRNAGQFSHRKVDVKVPLRRLRFPLFSQTSDYALRAIAHLASCRDKECTIPQMAEAIQVNSPYLRKVIYKLRDGGLVSTQRGTGGGIQLLVDPHKITLLDIVNAVDPLQHIEGCPLGLPDHVQLCPLHSELETAITQIEELLSKKTIGELLETNCQPSQCGFPKGEELYQL